MLWCIHKIKYKIKHRLNTQRENYLKKTILTLQNIVKNSIVYIEYKKINKILYTLCTLMSYLYLLLKELKKNETYLNSGNGSYSITY